MSEEPRTSRTPTSGLPALPLPRRIAPWARPVEIIERATQDELLQIRNDLMTVYREVEGEGSCRDVVTQLSAVSTALDRAGFAIVSSAMKNCVADPERAREDEGLTVEELEKLFLSLA